LLNDGPSLWFDLTFNNQKLTKQFYALSQILIERLAALEKSEHDPSARQTFLEFATRSPRKNPRVRKINGRWTVNAWGEEKAFARLPLGQLARWEVVPAHL